MRIAQLAPLYEDVPPTAYGGTERVIADLCDGLTAAGHEVTLFATGSSRTQARLEPVVSAPLRDRMTAAEMMDVGPHLHLRMLADVFERAADFDVIHSHTDLWTLPFTKSVATPTVLTLHGRLDLPSTQRLLPMYPEILTGLDQRPPATGARRTRRELGGNRPQRPRPRGLPPATSPGGNPSRLRRPDLLREASRPGGRDRPPNRAPLASRGQGRSNSTRSISPSPSSRCSIATTWSTWASSVNGTSRAFTPPLRRPSSRATGRSRSGW